MKTTEEMALQILLFCQFGIGTMANILLFVHNFSPLLTGCQLRPKQVICTHMAVSSILILFITVFANNVFVAQRNPPNDLKCKLEYFLYMVARSTNLCSTCVLSTYQFVTLVPSNFGELMLRGRSPKVISYSCCSCWLFGVLYNIYIPMKVIGPQNTHNKTGIKNKWICFTSGFSVGIVLLWFAHDAIFISIMVWTSVSMVLNLYRHYQRLQYIFTPHQDNRRYAEIRAAHSIMMLVVIFVSFYLLHCICFILHIVLVYSHLWLRHISEVLTSSFPTISPLVLIFRDPSYPCSVTFTY